MQLVAQHCCVASCRANVARISTLFFVATLLHEVEAYDIEGIEFATKSGNITTLRATNFLCCRE